ncbi:hypothetical protein [Pseudomonas phage D6]|nr:hypothetical protein [Pseudomonas phage D6]
MSHLVLVEINPTPTSLTFPQVTKEPLTCLESYADKVTDLYTIRQYGYHPEYGATLYEIIVDWGRPENIPECRKAELGEILEQTELEVALLKLQRQYEIVLEANCSLVRHEGRITRCQFKPKGEYRESPTNLDWTLEDPPARELV